MTVAKVPVYVVGRSFSKALAILIPPQIIRSSSFFSGLKRLGDAVTDFGAPPGTKPKGLGPAKSGTDYIIRKSGGAVADTAIGIALFGMPVTLVTAILSDGFKVASNVLKGAKTNDEEYQDLGEFFGDMGDVSGKFMLLFDVPSKQGAKDIRGSIDHLAKHLDIEGRLTDPISKELDGLRKSCDPSKLKCMCDEDRCRLSEAINDRLARIAELKLSDARIDLDTNGIKSFLKSPTVPNMRGMKDSLVTGLNSKGVAVMDAQERLVEEMVASFESFSTDDFHNRLDSLMWKEREARGKAKRAVGKTTRKGYNIARSLAKLTYRGASIFGRHYEDEIKGLLK